jgi:Flp pilus assembly protein CpaB
MTASVWVARAYIPPGTQITEAMIDRQPWPRNLVLDSFIISDNPADVVGKVTRSSIQPQEPLLITKLADIDDAGFLAASLPEGMRAITISIDAITGVAGFVFPGDHIDILFTHSIPSKGASAAAPKAPALGGMFGQLIGNAGGMGSMPGSASVAEVLAKNIPVLAVNVRKDTSPTLSSSAAGLIPTPEKLMSGMMNGGEGAPTNLTLQVTEQQAQQIRLAERVGNLSVSLRSIHDHLGIGDSEPTRLPDVTRVKSNQMTASIETDEVKVIRGRTDAAQTKTMGMPGMFNMMGR